MAPRFADLPPLMDPVETSPSSESSAPRFSPVERRDAISYEEFFRVYAMGRRPVVIRGQALWTGAEPFGVQILRERCGTKRLADLQSGIGGDIGLTDEQLARYRTLGGYLDALEAAVAKGGTHDVPYQTNVDIAASFPELVPDIQPPKYFLPNWISRVFASAASYTIGELFIGPPSTPFGCLHFDKWRVHVGTCQLLGRKQWWLFPPEESKHLYAKPNHWYPHLSPVDVRAPDLKKYPLFAKARGFTTVLEPGDILFCPDSWWHETQNLELSIATAVRIANRSNAVDAMVDYVRSRIVDYHVDRYHEVLSRRR